MTPNLGSSDFELFGLPDRFAQDIPAIDARWKQLQREVHPDKFAEYKVRAEELGFIHVASGPMVRSSYHADEVSAPRRRA